jgi:hypothetical protein
VFDNELEPFTRAVKTSGSRGRSHWTRSPRVSSMSNPGALTPEEEFVER